jgi:hypothetical protein
VTSPGLPGGAPPGFRVNETVSFTATGVNSTADISIKFASLPTTPSFYKITNGIWIQIYPTNNSSGIRNVFFSGNTLRYTITDNSAVDADPTVGTIKDPAAAGYHSSGVTVTASCFIATAAYGTSTAAHVQILRQFRDLFLLSNSAGRTLARLYYDYSPPVAAFISKHAGIRQLVRWSLLPLVGISWVAVKIGPLSSLLLLCLVFIGLGLFKTLFYG